MIRGYGNEYGRLRVVEGAAAPLESLLWIDLVNPTDAEEEEIEKRLGIDVPTKEEMEEIEISSRLYNEDGASFMTATLPSRADGDHPEMAPVTFILAGGRLITVRYHEPRAFQTFPRRAEKVTMGCETGEGVLIALLEAIVDRLADILERAGREIDGISRVTSSGIGQRSRPRARISRMCWKRSAARAICLEHPRQPRDAGAPDRVSRAGDHAAQER